MTLAAAMSEAEQLYEPPRLKLRVGQQGMADTA